MIPMVLSHYVTDACAFGPLTPTAHVRFICTQKALETGSARPNLIFLSNPHDE
jgi:hypothetical protein